MSLPVEVQLTIELKLPSVDGNDTGVSNYTLKRAGIMEILRDCLRNGTWIELSFISCIPGEDEGCQLNVKYFEDNNKVYELDFGWTNIAIKNYIEATSEFPVERLDGLYVSFEKHLFQLDWQQIDSNGIYRLGFFGSDQDFKIHADQASVRKFGADIKLEWESKQAPE